MQIGLLFPRLLVNRLLLDKALRLQMYDVLSAVFVDSRINWPGVVEPIGSVDGILSYPYKRATSSTKSASIVISPRRVGTVTVNVSPSTVRRIVND